MFGQSSSSDRLPCRKQMTRVNLLIFVLVGLLASTVPADVLSESAYTLKEAMENGVNIKLTSEGCYAGECVRVYHGFDAARAVLDEICEGYAPGLILTVYRPGDLKRDRWCVTRYQEVDEILAIAAD
jgi:hypothetical protein